MNSCEPISIPSKNLFNESITFCFLCYSLSVYKLKSGAAFMNRNLIEFWVRQAQAGNVEAFNQLAQAFEPLAQREAFRWLGDRHSAEDASQDALLAAYKHLNQLRHPGLFAAWFRQIVRSQCNLQTRKKQHRLDDIEEQPHLAAPSPSPEQDLEQREAESQIRQALAALPEHERIVAIDYYIAGKKQADIAENLGLPISTIKKRLQYARKKLRGMIA
jgi:RNA polymerase sigma factor (sigma-70 family)